jgi:thioredoxin 2
MAETVKLICETCGQANRVPRARLDEGPKCGACGAPRAARGPTAG